MKQLSYSWAIDFNYQLIVAISNTFTHINYWKIGENIRTSGNFTDDIIYFFSFSKIVLSYFHGKTGFVSIRFFNIQVSYFIDIIANSLFTDYDNIALRS